ncbi:MAG: hypothetical protein R8L53_02500 [Mariprofundales bacterium]
MSDKQNIINNMHPLLAMQTDAYHITMGYLIDKPWDIESHILYARRGGALAVVDLYQTLEQLLSSLPSKEEVEQAVKFWRSQGIPIAAEAWRTLATMDVMPVDVRGVIDGEVVLPGDPIAVLKAPAFLAGVLEPLLLGAQMASMQLATRFVRTATTVNWQTERIFEVGLRAVDSPQTHINRLRPLVRTGLKFTSHGQAAHQLGLNAVGTMGHRYTQRFTGTNADVDAFSAAIKRMLNYHQEDAISGLLPLSLLIDTRSTLKIGLPAAIKVMQQYRPEIVNKLRMSVRLDSGDLRSQLRYIIKAFQTAFKPEQWFDNLPGIILESGLTPEDIVDFETIAAELGFANKRLSYGLGGYLVGNISRDAIALVYKVSSFSGKATMKFADEVGGAKESYPGVCELWELSDNSHILALPEESKVLSAQGACSLFVDLVKKGQMQPAAQRNNIQVQQKLQQRWPILAHIKHPTRPKYSTNLQLLIDSIKTEMGIYKLHNNTQGE